MQLRGEIMDGILLAHGNYQELESYRNSVVIFDATADFCARFLPRGDRTIDQMVQASRSGKQNIVEGCMASGVSTETEIKLIGVARASLEELLEDYRDYLRTHSLPLWEKSDERVLAIRRFSRTPDKSYETYKTHFHLDDNNAETFCNVLVSLIHQTNYLLDRQLKALEGAFVGKGGLRERMHRARSDERAAQREEALSLLREIYRELADAKRPDLMAKIGKVADIVKGGAK